MINGNSYPLKRSVTGLLAGVALGLSLTSCEAVKEKPGQIKVPIGAEVNAGDRQDQIIITTSEQAAPAVDCGRADRSVLGFRLPIELGGYEVNQSGPIPNKSASPGHVDTICTDPLISKFNIVPVKVFLKTVTQTTPNATRTEQPDD